MKGDFSALRVLTDGLRCEGSWTATFYGRQRPSLRSFAQQGDKNGRKEEKEQFKIKR